MLMREMNILYSIDEWKKDYSRYLWVSILSLLEHNKDENIHIYILSKYIEDSNKNEIIRIINDFWKKITFSEGEGDIIPKKFKDIIKMNWRHPLAAYYRLFFPMIFNINDRVLYLDCDTIINSNLWDLYNTDFEWNTFIANLDLPITVYMRNKQFWFKNYINSWALLINIDSFKKIDIYSDFKRANEEFWVVDYVDQDYINYLYWDRIKLYRNMQSIIFFKWWNLNLDWKIIHTIMKPNLWWYWYCPRKIEKLFNTYLVKTKRSNYVWWKRKTSTREYLNYLYTKCNLFTLYFVYRYFWVKYAYNWNIFSKNVTKFLILIKKSFQGK